MNKLKTKLDGALKDIHMTDRLKGEIITMTEKRKKAHRWIPIAIAACLVLVLTGGAYAATDGFTNFQILDDIVLRFRHEEALGANEDLNIDNVKSILEADEYGGLSGEIKFDTLDEVNGFLGVTLYKSEYFDETPVGDNDPQYLVGCSRSYYESEEGRYIATVIKHYTLSPDLVDGSYGNLTMVWTMSDKPLNTGTEIAFGDRTSAEFTQMTSENGLVADVAVVDGHSMFQMVFIRDNVRCSMDVHINSDADPLAVAQTILDSFPAAD